MLKYHSRIVFRAENKWRQRVPGEHHHPWLQIHLGFQDQRLPALLDVEFGSKPLSLRFPDHSKLEWDEGQSHSIDYRGDRSRWVAFAKHLDIGSERARSGRLSEKPLESDWRLWPWFDSHEVSDFCSLRKPNAVLNDRIRNTTRKWLDKYGRMGKYFLPKDLFRDGDGFDVFASFASLFANGSESWLEKFNELIDSHLIIRNISLAMGKIAKDYRLKSPYSVGERNETLFRQWMIASSPIRFRLWNKLECSDRFYFIIAGKAFRNNNI